MRCVQLSDGGFQVICGPGHPELSKSYMDTAIKSFTFTDVAGGSVSGGHGRPPQQTVLDWARMPPYHGSRGTYYPGSWQRHHNKTEETRQQHHSSYKRVKERGHSVEERASRHTQKPPCNPHATAPPYILHRIHSCTMLNITETCARAAAVHWIGQRRMP